MAYSTINKSSDYFNTKLYIGNGYPETGTQSITGVGFQPDFLWIKNRDDTQNNNLSDVIRGAEFRLKSNSASEESELIDSVLSYDSDGFSIGAGSDVNSNLDNNVAWSWKANGAGSANTDGTISSTVSANTTSGFSIVSYTGNGTAGATVGHGLGVTPSWIVTKKRSATGSWVVYHKSQGATKYGILDTNATFGTSSSLWNDTEPTSSVFSVGTDADTNGSGSTFIAYCFADVQGYSKFGSYIGNGSTDGTFIYTGFKPAFVMVKKYAGTGSWFMKDVKRNPYNPTEETLAADSISSEATWGTGDDIDLLSNGFKMRDDTGNINTSGDGYIYMAFAEAPLVGSNNVCATAR